MLEAITRNGSLGTGSGIVGPFGDDGADAEIEKAAPKTATDGAQRAGAAGLGVRDLPRRLPIYKLIWREHYRSAPGPGTSL
jgi:hypothetical protein